MYDNDILRELHRLALGNPDREAILKARRGRESSRARGVTCQACGGTERYTKRGKDDVCHHCLRDLWQAADLVKAMNEREVGNGLIPVVMVERAHNLPFPPLANNLKVPQGAVFDRSRPGGFGAESAQRTMQQLFHEFMAAMNAFAPVGTEGRRGARIFLAGSTMFNHSQLAAYLPEGALKTMEDLWCFILWASNQAYLDGLEEGTNLLRRLNAGTLPQSQFDADLEKQKTYRREGAVSAAAGDKGRIS